MKVSEQGLELIKKFEEFRPEAYQCAAGKWTVGYGTTAGVTAKTTVTQAQATELLEAYLREQDISLAKLGLNLKQNEYDAVASLCYNIGMPAFTRSVLCKRIKGQAPRTEIEAAWRSFRKGGGKILQGLVNRRAAELAVYFGQ